MANTTLPDYPAPPGNKYTSIVDIAGPSSYTVITTATPPTGGQVIKASDIGMTQIEWAQACGSDNGQYDGVIYITNNPSKAGVPSIQIQWITAATGAEVTGTTNLSARTLRVMVVGR